VTKILTYSGTVLDLAAPKPSDVKLVDIVKPLANIGRFNEHLGTRITVLQHSLLVASLVGYKARPYALLHDAHEAYIGDLATPVAEALIESVAFAADESLPLDAVRAAVREGIDELKEDLDRVIFMAFGMDYFGYLTHAEEIAEADRMALSIEKEFFDNVNEEVWLGLPEPLSVLIPPNDQDEFMVELLTWCPEVPA
jgi:hypothetical protein